MEFKTAEAQRDELLQRARRKGLPVRTGQRRVKAEPAWLRDADLAAQKYTEAVAVAVEKCAGDTAGQTCYICKDYTGTLVRGCACRGTAGFAHVSCLAYQARSLVEVKHEVKKAYKALAILFHPDKCSAPDASDAMQKINTARQKLLVAATSERECAPPPPPPPSTPAPHASPPRPT